MRFERLLKEIKEAIEKAGLFLTSRQGEKDLKSYYHSKIMVLNLTTKPLSHEEQKFYLYLESIDKNAFKVSEIDLKELGITKNYAKLKEKLNKITLERDALDKNYDRRVDDINELKQENQRLDESITRLRMQLLTIGVERDYLKEKLEKSCKW